MSTRLLKISFSWAYWEMMHKVLTTKISYIQVILFEITIFYTNLQELFCQFISWTNWVNSGKFMDNCWIPCQVMAEFTTISKLLTCNWDQLCHKKKKVHCESSKVHMPTQFNKMLSRSTITSIFVWCTANISTVFPCDWTTR